MKGIKKALCLLVTLSMVAGLFTAVPPSVVRAEEGEGNGEAGIVVDFTEDMSISDNSTYLMVAGWFEYDGQGPASMGMDEDGNHHYMNKWFVTYGETSPAKLALLTAHVVEGTEEDPQYEWSLADEIPMDSICVKDSEGNEIGGSGADVQYGTYGSFYPDDENARGNETDTFLFLKEGNYWISYTKDDVEYKLPVATIAPQLGFYSADSIAADNMLRDEMTYTDEDSKTFYAGLSLDSEEVAGYRILMEREDGKEDWEYSYCDADGERKDINEFLTIGETEGNITSGKEQVMIPLTVKEYVPEEFFLNLAVELTYTDENRSPEVRTCGIQVSNRRKKLLVTWEIGEAEDGQVFVADGAEYFNDWYRGMDDPVWVAFQLSNDPGTTLQADNLKLVDAEGNRLEVAVIEREDEETEENTKDKAAIMRKVNEDGSIVEIKFLQMGDFYLQSGDEAPLSIHVGLPTLGLYTGSEFSEETYAWSQYELRSDAPEKALYVMLQTEDWHKEIEDTDVKLSVYRDWEHKDKVEYPGEGAEPESPLENSDYIEGSLEKIASEENILAYKITFKDKVPDSFLLKVEVERTDKENDESSPIDRLIEVKYVQVSAELTGIRITKQPLKTTYTVGETFDKTGMEVTADYNDGTTEVVTDYEVNPSRSFTAGDKSVTISYEGKSVALNITVAEEGGGNSEAGIVVDFTEDMSITDNSTYLMVAPYFMWDVEWPGQGPVSVEMDEEGNHHYANKWVVNYGEISPAKLALLTVHVVEDTEDEPQYEWSLADEIPMDSICVKDSEGNEIDISSNEADVQYGTYASFNPEDENARENDTATFLFLKEGSYLISYTKDDVEYKLPVETIAPELGFYSVDSIAADNMLRNEMTYTDENSKTFYAGLSLDSEEVAGYRILMEREDGKEDWEYSYCEVDGERKDINEFLTIGDEIENEGEKKQVMIPLTVKAYVPGDFFLHLAVELTYTDENRSPEVRTCDIPVINSGKKLLMTDWIDWSEEGQVSVADGAEYFNDWWMGMDDQVWAAFQLSNDEGATLQADNLKLVDAEGKRLEVAVIEREDEETEENTKDKAAIMRKANEDGSIVGIKFLQMGDFYLQSGDEAPLSIHVGLPTLGLYTASEFSEETYAWSQYELKSNAQEKALYVMLQKEDWHKEIEDTDVKLSVYRDWEHRFKVDYPEEGEEPERPLENSDYIAGSLEKIASEENILAYKITFKDKVPDSFLLKVEVERTNKENDDSSPIGRLIEVKYVQVPATLTGIRITKQPLKTTYTVGETFDKTGMEVTADYDDGTTKVITDYVVNPSRSFTADDKSVTISYEGKSVALNITVKEKTPVEVPEKKLTGIRITKQPLKTTYTVGETFDKTGMEVTADYDDGTTKVITDYVVNPSRSFTAGDKSVTISYEGKSASLNITVKEKAPEKVPEKVPEKKPAKQKGAGIEQDSVKYTVTDAKADGTGTVAYAGTADKNAKTIKIPAVITDSETGVSYKVTSIKKNALKNSKALTGVTIGSNVTKIEDGAFSSCKKLKKITIPGSVTSIGKNAFKNCSALTTVTIGKKVTSIGGSAFNGCKKLKSITIKSTVLKTVGSNAFKGINSKATIKVPKKQKSAYKKLITKKGKAPKKVKIK